MSRGRKLSSSFTGSEWESVFYNSVGTYVNVINNELSKEIALEPLSRYIKIGGGYAFKTSEYKKSGIPIIRISDFNNEQIDISNCVYYDENDSLSKYELKENDIIICLTGGTIAKLGIVQSGLGTLYMNQRIGRFDILDDSKFEKEYVYWIARSVQSIIKNLAWGAAIPNVSPKQIEELKFPFPSKEIQNGIVTFLNELKNNSILEDRVYFNKQIEKEIIELHHKQINTSLISSELSHQLSLIKQLRQAFLREAMQGLLVKTETNGETGAQLLEKIKAEKAQLVKDKKLKKEKELPPISEEEIPFEIPEHWAWCRLGEVCNYGNTSRAEPKGIMNETWVLDLEDIEKETSKLICKVRFSERKSLSTKSKFKKGDVLYSKLRPYLDKVIVADEDGVCTSEILPLKLFGNINPNYLRFTLKRGDFLAYVNSVTKGMKMPRLGTYEGQSALIPLPPLNEQEQIVSKLDELMAFCDGLEESIKASQDMNEKLLQEVLREALQGEGVNA